jgi:hypothetical protein
MGSFQAGRIVVALMLLSITLFAGLNLGGCASPRVLPATSHMATTPDKVRIYQKPPSEYEQLGTIELPITGDLKLDENGAADKAYAALLQQAAAKGANGLLLWSPPGTYDIVVHAANGKETHQVPVRTKPAKTAIAQAIFVRFE